MQIWQVVIFMVNGKANHVGLNIPELGLGDLSLLGARVTPWAEKGMPKGERLFFDIKIQNPEATLNFLRQPGLLCEPIIAQERAQKGWHLTHDAPDFVRTLRSSRSLDPDDMNCVEWIVRALELGTEQLPLSLMTPTELLNWCQQNLTPSQSQRLKTEPDISKGLL
ncbi:MAG: hypothetical protein IT289_12815 [Oligoflexia bacterium]|nr:hypothetical protein [Oligoflexia bacterium]